MKNSLKHISFLLIAFLMIGCQKEEPTTPELNLGEQAKAWYEINHNRDFDQNSYFYGEPNWSNYFTVDNTVYVPLQSLRSSKKKLQKNTLTQSNTIHAKSFITLEETANGSFNESLKAFLTSDRNNFATQEQTLELPYMNHFYKEDGKLKVTQLQQTKKEVVNEGLFHTDVTNEIAAKDMDCDVYYVVETTTYTDGTQTTEVLSTFQICGVTYSGGGSGGGSGSGNGGGDGGSGIGDGDLDLTTSDTDFPPDCSSFKFEKLPNVSWQETLVKGMYFKITLLQVAPVRVKLLHRIEFREPIKFGVPTVDRHGNRVPAYLAAQVTKEAIHQTMKEITSRYGNKNFSTLYVATKFQELLKKNIPDYTYGGRVNFNDMTSTQTPTQYEATFNPNQNCR